MLGLRRTAGEPSPAAAARTSGRCSSVSVRRCCSPRPCARCAHRRAASSFATGDGTSRSFDGVVVATSAPRALALLEDPSDEEREILSAFETTANETVLHTDAALLPERRVGSLLVELPVSRLRRLRRQAVDHLLAQPAAAARRDGGVLRHAQPHRRDRPGSVIRVIGYEHPQGDVREPRGGARARAHGVERHTAFAGAWQGNGFHEDGLASGLRAAAAFGATW